MGYGLTRLKPGASKKTHLFLAACLWSGIGVLLLTKGGYRISQDASSAFTLTKIFVSLAAVTVGYLKSRIILDKAANKAIDRILHLKDGTCLGAVYSYKTWIIVLSMMGTGVLLRNSDLPVILLVFIYFTIGSALLYSSRLAWCAWLRNVRC